MTIASWLVVVERGRAGAVRRALTLPGIDCRSEAYDTLVVVTETPAEGLDPVRHRLRETQGVREVLLVTRYDDAPAVELRPRPVPAHASISAA